MVFQIFFSNTVLRHAIEYENFSLRILTSLHLFGEHKGKVYKENTENLGLFEVHKILSEYTERISAYMEKTPRDTNCVQHILVNNNTNFDFLRFFLSTIYGMEYTKYVYIRVPQCMSPRRNGTLSTPLSPASMPLPPEPGGEGQTRLRVMGWGSLNSDDLRKA